MTWQSVAIGAIQVLFSVSLVPTIINKNAQVPRKTSVISTVGLLSLAAVFTTLSLWVAMSSTLLCACAWAFVAIFRPIKVPT